VKDPPLASTAVHATGGNGWSFFLRTFGLPALVRISPDGDQQLAIEMSKPLALITYLIFAPGRTATRDTLVDLLWANLDPEAGRHAVRQHLWQLKRTLGSDLIVEGRDRLVLRTPIDSDRAQFVDASERADFSRAVELYTGEFFPGFAAAGTGEFERWVDGERWELRSRFLRCAEVVVRNHLDAHRTREAVGLARRIRASDPLRQPGWRLLLEALIAANDLVSAAVECDALERLLGQEGDVPEPATSRMIAAVRRAGPAGSTSVPAPVLQPELVGREREFATLIHAWERASRGAAVVVGISAEAGLGKTRLLAELCARLQSMRARCVSVQGNAGATSLPFALASDLAEQLGMLPGSRGVSPHAARILVALNPALSSAFDAVPLTSDPGDAVRHRLSALRELLSAVAAERPVAILIDDLHWADGASREILDGLIGNLKAVRVLLCLSTRPVAHPPFHTGVQVPLEPLAESAILSLVSSIAALPVEPWAERWVHELHRGSGGVPLDIVESLQLAREEQLLAIENGAWVVTNEQELWRQMASGGVLRRRLDRLDGAERRLLEVLALAATPLSQVEVVEASGITDPLATAGLSSLQRKGLTSVHDGLYRVGHDTLASLVVEQIDEASRVTLDRALGVTLGRDASDLHRVQRAASHLVRAGADADLGTLFTRYFAATRQRRDPRNARVLAREILGENADPHLADRLSRSLPWHVVLESQGPLRLGVMSVGLVLLGLSLGMLLPGARSRTPPDAFVRAWIRKAQGHSQLVEVPLRRDAWTGGEPIRVDEGRVLFELDGTWQAAPMQSPSGTDNWSGVRAVPDSGVTDLYLLSDGGRRQERLTRAAGDDVDPSWSPDGKFVVFSTARWDSRGKRDLAILTLADGSVRQVTAGPASDVLPKWSPDGTRIGFVRVPENGPSQPCVSTVDGSRTRCAPVNSGKLQEVLGWDSDTSFYGSVDLAATGRLIRVTERDVLEVSFDSTNRIDGISPDGRWVAGACPGPGSTDRRCVYPTGRREIARELTPNADMRFALSKPVEFLADLVATNADAPVIVGTPFEVTARGRSTTGRRVPIRALSLRALSPSDAEILGNDVLVARTPGEVTLELSAGGWRVDTVRLSVLSARDSVLLTEDWRTPERQWHLFGDPVPTVEEVGANRALYIAGNGQFHSGVYLRRPLDATYGLYLRARVRAPVSRREWQSISVTFLTHVDRATLDQWDHRTGYLWNGGRLRMDEGGFCGMVYPEESERQASRDSLALQGARGPLRTVGAPDVVKSRRWYEVVVQVLPDRRCGVAVNGEVLGFTAPSLTPLDSVYPSFFGNSVETMILIGEVHVGNGVAPGIDWRQIPQRGRMHQ